MPPLAVHLRLNNYAVYITGNNITGNTRNDMKAPYFFVITIVLSVMTALAGCDFTGDFDKPFTLDGFEKALRDQDGGLLSSDPVDIAYFGSGRAHDLYVILAVVSKYVNLDLSESSVTGFEDAVYASGSNMIVSLILPDNLAVIEDRAFDGWDRLSGVTLPKNVLSIGDYAFEGCGALASVTIPKSVVGIGESAFSGCGKLSSVTIPSGVVSIGDNAFSSCNALISVTFMGSGTSVAGDSAFPSGANLRAAAGGSGTGPYQPNSGTYSRNNGTWWRN
jgi:hypothetical protein